MQEKVNIKNFICTQIAETLIFVPSGLAEFKYARTLPQPVTFWFYSSKDGAVLTFFSPATSLTMHRTRE